MIERGEHYIMPNLASIAKGHSSMILKVAAGIDEYILAHRDVLSKIRIKRRKHTKRPRHLIAK